MKKQAHRCDVTAHQGQTEALYAERNLYAALARSLEAALTKYKAEHDQAAGGLCACPLCLLAGPLLGIE